MDSGGEPQQNSLPFTGERFVPGHGDAAMAVEHMHRYLLAATACVGQRVLDLGCGAGYGSEALLAAGAKSVVAVDVSLEAVSSVVGKGRDPLGAVADATALPLADQSFDAVVSFEVIEHIHDPEGLVREAARVLRPDGMFIVSTPDRFPYNAGLPGPNPFHVSEMELEEFRAMLLRHFASVQLHAQKAVVSSIVWPLAEFSAPLSVIDPAQPPPAPFIIAVCSETGRDDFPTSAFTLWAEDSSEREAAARSYIAELEAQTRSLVDALAASDRRESNARNELDRLSKLVSALEGGHA